MAEDVATRVKRRIREGLAQALGQRVSVDDWGSLTEKGYIEDVVDDYPEFGSDDWLEERVQYMAAKLRDRWDTFERDRVADTWIPLNLPATILTDLDAVQAIARSYAIADEAASLSIVSGFRNDELDGRLLSRDDAIEYLAARLPSGGWYDHDPDAPDEYWSDREGRYWVPLAEHRPFAKAAKSLFVSLPTIHIPGDGTTKPLADRNGPWKESSLHSVACELAALQPWTEGQAAWFLLTGGVPYVSPVRASVDMVVIVTPDGSTHLDRTTIHLDYSEWVSPETVRRLQVHVQRDILGQANKDTGQSSYEMYIVMAELKRRHGQRVPPAVVKDTWQRYVAQRGSPLESKDVSAGAIRRAYGRVERALRRSISEARGDTVTPEPSP